MLSKAVTLKFYKRKDIQEAIIEHARNKEVGSRFGDGFGKRPDILSYPRDVIELALRGMTSLHTSEEIWSNPLMLDPNLNRKDLDELRSGWDLVLDIDCPDWEISKLTAYLFIKALKAERVKDISCKFSGNKGFHIGVPFEAFPKTVEGKPTHELFPEAPKKIAQYLLDKISSEYIIIEEDKVFFNERSAFSLEDLKIKFGERSFVIYNCSKCKKKVELNRERKIEFICPSCENIIKDEGDNNFKKCEKCNILMQKVEAQETLCKCGSDNYISTFNPLSVVEVDTILISSRHLYRMPYSLHEKSGLVSLPIDPNKVLQFEKEMAKPEAVLTPMFKFLDRNVSEESGRQLLARAWDHDVKLEEERKDSGDKKYQEMVIESPITEEFFPPCVKLILNGVEDGKKRAIFVLMNFLGKIGWSKKEVEDFIIKWNKEKNREPLREVYIKGQLNHFKPGDKLPPNCDNEGYYLDLDVCKPDGLCKRIKNPVNYTIVKWKRMLRNRE